MTRIAIIGGGPGAAVHAEAARATTGVELIGVGGRRQGTATALAEALGVPDRPVDDLLHDADGVVIAVPPRAVPVIMGHIQVGFPALVESPVGIDPAPRPRTATAVNLLHANVVKQALRAIHDLGGVHHLVLRSRSTRPTWGHHGTTDFAGGALLDPAAGSLPVLLAAAGVPVVDVAASLRREGPIETSASLSLGLSDGRRIRAELDWIDGPGDTVLEAASESGVVSVQLWPRPTLEINGEPLVPPDEPPLVALGFTEQMRRFAAVAAGRAEPWPPRSVGDGIMALAEAAARSSRADGTTVPCAGQATTDPAAIFAEKDPEKD
jgi:predicted dehydrogenase